ncbi:hypothetical protein D3C87_2029670 [compost metagenome]
MQWLTDVSGLPVNLVRALYRMKSVAMDERRVAGPTIADAAADTAKDHSSVPGESSAGG